MPYHNRMSHFLHNKHPGIHACATAERSASSPHHTSLYHCKDKRNENLYFNFFLLQWNVRNGELDLDMTNRTYGRS